MRPEYVLRARLLQSPELASLVGTRIMPAPRPQSGTMAELPAVVYQRISPGPRFSEHGGPSRIGMPRVQFSCFARSEADAWATAEAVRQALDGWSDYSSTPRIDGVSTDEPVDMDYEHDTKIFAVRVDAIVRYGR